MDLHYDWPETTERWQASCGSFLNEEASHAAGPLARARGSSHTAPAALALGIMCEGTGGGGRRGVPNFSNGEASHAAGPRAKARGSSHTAPASLALAIMGEGTGEKRGPASLRMFP